jgi:hypothetical protein
LGRVLMSIGELTERDLATAIEIQSLLREGVISSEFGIRALNVAVKGCVPIEEAFSRLGWKAPQRESMPSGELGELLLEAGIVTHKVLDDAVVQSQENNLPLGRCLVLARALGSPILASALTAQVLLRDGKITREQAINGLKAALKKHQTLEASLQESGAYKPASTTIRMGELLTSAGILTEGDKISAIEIGLVTMVPVGQVLVQNGMITERILDDTLKLQEMVSNGQITGAQASEVLRTAHTRGVPAQVVLGERSSKEDEISRANVVADLLSQVGMLTPEQLAKAEGVGRQLNVTRGEVLLSTGVIDKRLMQATLQAQTLLEDGILKLDHVKAILHYCQKTGVDFPEALKEVSWAPPTNAIGSDRDAQSTSWLGKLFFKGKRSE